MPKLKFQFTYESQVQLIEAVRREALIFSVPVWLAVIVKREFCEIGIGENEILPAINILNPAEYYSFVIALSMQNDGITLLPKNRSKILAPIKANTALDDKVPSGTMRDKVLASRIAIAAPEHFTNIIGGIPLITLINGESEEVGALGISGGTPSQDYLIGTRAARKTGYDAPERWENLFN